MLGFSFVCKSGFNDRKKARNCKYERFDVKKNLSLQRLDRKCTQGKLRTNVKIRDLCLNGYINYELHEFEAKKKCLTKCFWSAGLVNHTTLPGKQIYLRVLKDFTRDSIFACSIHIEVR